jgi:hypothetical protein
VGDTANSFAVPGYLSAAIGTRKTFAVWDRPVVLRAVVSNLDTSGGWMVQPSGQFNQTPSVSARASLGVTF